MLQSSNRAKPYRISSANAIIALFFLALSGIAYPQEAEEPPAQEKRKQTKPALESLVSQDSPDQQKGFKIGVSVDLVLMYTTVIDPKNQFVAGLKQENFRVFEDGVQQTISAFSQEDVPISMGILIDLSLSMRKKIDHVNKAALAFIRASNPQDQVFLIGFNDNADLLQDFTNDIDEITDSLENAAVMGSTAIYDAVYLGVQKAHTGNKPKKAIVVITDGEDRDSFYSLSDLLAKVQESDVQVFCIGFLNAPPPKGLFGGWSKSVPEKARDALQKISEETGGTAFFPAATADLNDIVSEIATELRSQYAIGYYSSNSARDGSFRRVKIELSGSKPAERQLRYRRGYFAPKTDITQNK
jgi:Ca-activated chloride channel family protein